MKAISLNIWGGKVTGPLLAFIEAHKDVDVFCFQEVFDHGRSLYPSQQDIVGDIFSRIAALLPEHKGYFQDHMNDDHGLAIFVRRSLHHTDYGVHFVIGGYDDFIPKDAESEPKFIQYIVVDGVLISHMHGRWKRVGKIDTPDRLVQSRNARAFVSRFDRRIFMGDLNLSPDTESIAILEDGMRNLIRENKIKTTRSSLYGKENPYADYCFVSPSVAVKDFKVLPDEVSDHMALYVEFS